EPQPKQPWHELIEANTLHKCIQYNHYTEPGEEFVIGDEDCLHLNIYTPNTDTDTVFNVIIYIHGGAFMFNHGGSYRPNIILDKDVVLVTLNYRLGPLGFLSTEDNVLPGNNGLKDQLLALKWIKDNIKYFGGNPDSITLTGMSAGGASAQLHTLSPLSQGLFHRGISQSGTALNPWVLVENSRKKSIQLATHLGCPTTVMEDMINCLREKPAYDVVATVKHFQPWLYNPFSPFGVVVDKWSSEPFLPEHPYILLRNGKVQDLPYIFSNVEAEGLYPAADFIGDPKHLDEINSRWNELMPHILDFHYTLKPQQQFAVLQEIRDFYFRGQPVYKSTFNILVKLISDRLFMVDIERAARLHSAAIKSPVYYYYFTYRGAHSKSELRSRSNKNYGAAHADDTTYVLSSNVDTQTTDDDRKMSKLMVDMWISFANTSTPQIEDIKWPGITKDTTESLPFLLIESPTKLSVKSATFLGNRQFWDTFPFQENKNIVQLKDEL
ncbi:hypothetical protein ILUMI_09830, partial [Ignelater luminosus]